MGTDSGTLSSRGSPHTVCSKEEEQRINWIVPPGLQPEVERFIGLWKTLLRESKTTGRKRPLMICGPSGVGKSLFVSIAEKLYCNEYGAKRPVRINCAALAPTLIESELFGYAKGAFTGAVKDKEGFVEKAADGLLILEEIGELDKNVQAKLLTFISRGQGINLRLSGGKVFSACSFKDGCFSGILPSEKWRRVSWKKSDTREDLILSQTLSTISCGRQSTATES